MSYALVTGAAKGLGAATVLALADAGFDPIIHYRASEEEAKAVAEECLAMGRNPLLFQYDLRSPDFAQAAAEFVQKRRGSLAVVVNNVGEYLVGPISETKREEWSDLFLTNLHAPVALTHALLPDLIESKGRVINMGCAGLEGPKAARHSPAYRCTKVALLSWTRSLAAELAMKGVTVNMVSPGRMSNSVELSPERIAAIPAGYVGEPNEVARAVRWLAADESRYITGQNIEVAGGLLL